MRVFGANSGTRIWGKKGVVWGWMDGSGDWVEISPCCPERRTRILSCLNIFIIIYIFYFSVSGNDRRRSGFPVHSVLWYVLELPVMRRRRDVMRRRAVGI